MTIDATVIRTDTRSLLVRNRSNNQEILVHYNNTRGFSNGDVIRITFNGQMTNSIPPQITATSIQKMQGPGPSPTPPRPPQSIPAQTRATVLQRRREALLVRDMSNNRQLLVHTPYAHHFCVRQRILIRHDTIVMNNPPEINAIEITPIC